MTTKIQFINETAKELYNGKLEYATNGSAGFDLRVSEFCSTYARFVGQVKNFYTLASTKTIKIGTGIKIAAPQGYATFIYPRSGFSTKNEVILLNSVGVIDNDYTGEIIVCLKNISDKPVEIALGDRIAQAVIQPVLQTEFEYVEELEATERGNGGFGSTGK